MRERDAISETQIERLRSWRHSGFRIYSERCVEAEARSELEELLQYILRPPISLRRLSYGDDRMCTYRGRYNPALRRDYQHLSAPEFLALLLGHLQPKHQCAIHYFGALSTTIRRAFGCFEKTALPEEPTTAEPSKAKDARAELSEGEATDSSTSTFLRPSGKTWARLIRKTWGEDPELCPRCGARMRLCSVISSPAQDEVIEKILTHLGAWRPPWLSGRSQGSARGPPAHRAAHRESFVDTSYSQLLAEDDCDFNQDFSESRDP